MKGTINGIWLTNNGLLHPKVVPNLVALVPEATLNNFQIILWTNKVQVSEADLKMLFAHNIVVKDYSECSSSRFYSYFLTFFEKGMQGDKAALALASDILRMSLLEQTPEDEYYIYFDPNDITFPNFGDSLAQLDKFMRTKLLGFSFYAESLFGSTRIHLRNDVLIARKGINPQFFEDYIAYAAHLESTTSTYFTPKSDKEAQELARQISSQTTDNFFQIIPPLSQTSPTLIRPTFGSYLEILSSINCSAHFPYERHLEDANTWLPHGLCLEESAELEAIFGKGLQIDKPACVYVTSSRELPGSLPYVSSPPIYEVMKTPILPFSLFCQTLLPMLSDKINKSCKEREPLPLKLTHLGKRMLSTVERSLENPHPLRTLSSSNFFRQAYKDYITEYRHDSPELQEEYDQQYGLVVKK